MANDGDWEVVMTARRGLLEHARKRLSDTGIACRSSRPGKAEGILRVKAADAERVRALLTQTFGAAVVVNQAHASWYRCHACGEGLSLGARTCPACHAYVDDPHGG